MNNFITNFGVMKKKDPNVSEAGNKAMVEEYTARINRDTALSPGVKKLT